MRLSVFIQMTAGALLCIAVHGSNMAMAAVDAKEFDLDKNGKIDPGDEATAYLKHINSELYQKIDKNKDGVIQPEERKRYFGKLDEKVSDRLVEFDQRRGARSGIPVSEANATFSKQSAKPSSLGGFLIREKHEDVTVLKDAKEFKKADGALLSFARDVDAQENTWTAKGVVMRPFRVSTGKIPSTKDGGLTAYTIVPSIAFDRVNKSKNKDKEVNSLVFRLGSEFEYQGGGFLPSQYFRANLGYATDSDFRSAIPVAELQWEPVHYIWGIGTSRDLPGGFLEYRLRAIAHAEAGTTLDAGEKSNLKEDDAFVRIGPKLEVEFWPTAKALERLSVNLKWQFLKGLTGEPSASRLFEAGLKFALDEAGHAQLQAQYRNGDVPLTKEETEEFLVGLGIKF